MQEHVAAKLEHIDAECPQLEDEANVYNFLEDTPGIPTVRWSGIQDEYSVIVMDCLGMSLEALFNHCRRRFSLNTVILLGSRMVRDVYSYVFINSHYSCS